MSCPLTPDLLITVTPDDYWTARRRQQAYCPLAAALARTHPTHFNAWHCGSFLAPVLGEYGGCYVIPESAQAQIIRPYDRGALDVAILPFTLTLTWKDATEGEQYNFPAQPWRVEDHT